MKIDPYLFASFLLFTVISQVTAQNIRQSDQFISDIEKYLSDMTKDPSNFEISKKSGRKIKLRGKLNYDSDTLVIYQKIKHTRGGLKKDQIVIKRLPPKRPSLLLKAILIDNKFFYIRKITYSKGEKIKKVAEEELIDGKIYQKTNFKFGRRKKDTITTWKLR